MPTRTSLNEASSRDRFVGPFFVIVRVHGADPMHRICTQRTARGVTLIETIMVILLLGMAAIASSFLFDGQWVPKRNVTNVTSDVAATLHAARNTAITNRAIIRVRRLRSGGKEQLTITEDAGPFSAGKSRTIELGSDVSISGAPLEIRFNPTGSANRNLRWSIRQSQTQGRVIVSPADGQITTQLP